MCAVMPGMPTHSLLPRLGPEAGHSEKAATGLGGSFRKVPVHRGSSVVPGSKETLPSYYVMSSPGLTFLCK